MVKKPSNFKVLNCGRPKPELPLLEDQKYQKWQEQLRTYLETNKLKFSEQRWKIAKLILDRRGHLSAQEIVQAVIQVYPGIGPATVYRNIKVLCEARILKETLVDAKGISVFEAYDELHHDHIVCLDCNEIFEFHEPQIEKVQTQVVTSQSFTEVRHRHVIYVRCDYKKIGRKSK